MFKQNVLRAAMSEDLLLGTIVELKTTTINFNNHFLVILVEVEKGHIEKYQKCGTLDHITRQMEK